MGVKKVRQNKVEMFGMPLFWAAGFGAMISEGFGVPFVEVSGLIYFGILAASWSSWRSGCKAHQDEVRVKTEHAVKDLEKFREEFIRRGLADKVLKWRGDGK